MTEETIEVQAASLDEARRQIQAQVPDGLVILSEEVLSDGRPVSLHGTGETFDTAGQEVLSKVPQDATSVERREIHSPAESIMQVEAFDDDAAVVEARKHLSDTQRLLGVTQRSKGGRGFLGIGRRPNVYDARVFQQAVVQVTFNPPARLRVEVGNWSTMLEKALAMTTPAELPPGTRDSRNIKERKIDALARSSLSLPPLSCSEDEETARELVRLLSAGYRMKIREIGKRLYETGGEDRMKLLCYRVGHLGGLARTLEMAWDGIGPWRG